MTDQCAVSEPKPPPTAESVDKQWRDWGLIEVASRNYSVSDFIRVKEREVEGLWNRIRHIASQTDPAWALRLAQHALAEREA